MPKLTPELHKKIKKIGFAVIGVVIGYFGFMYGINPYLPWEPDPSLNPDPNHTHADFAVWVNDEMLDFTDNKYMSGLSYDDASHDEEKEYLHKYLHLHDNIGHVIHMHKPGLDLAEFFDSIGLIMTDECFTFDDGRRVCNEGADKWRMFVNGEEMAFDPGFIFKDIDDILLTYAPSEDELQHQFDEMTDDACRYSKACPWRGKPPEENCVADPAVPCIGADLEDDFS